jgi:Tfp pilus assembly PilM family ATPase
MRASSTFFKLFPPPTFLLMPHAGLDISDDAILALSYSGFGHSRKLDVYGGIDLPPGLVMGGDVKDEKEFVSYLSAFAKDHGLYHVKVSVPEEKAYLFQTDVPVAAFSEIVQNIEFKLEENVPLAAPDALFYFDLIPPLTPTEPLRASVSVVPRTYVEHYISLLEQAALSPVAFEVVPKAIARAIVPPSAHETRILIHVMNKKTGIYVVSGNVVNFASTVGWGGGDGSQANLTASAESLAKEIVRVYSYWGSHGTGRPIDEIVLVGKNAQAFETALGHVGTAAPKGMHIADIWRNAFDLDKYLPPISRVDSLEYAVAAGMALELSQETSPS